MRHEIIQNDLSLSHMSCTNCAKSLQLKNAFRCSRCQMAYYCNQSCQKSHWYHGHKAHCRAITSLKELNGLISEMSDQPIQESFQTSLDVIESIRNMPNPHALDETWISKIRANSNVCTPRNMSTKSLLSTQQKESNPPSMDFDTYYKSMKSHRRRCDIIRASARNKRSADIMGDIYVEHFPRLFTFNIRFRIPQSSQPTDFVNICQDDLSVVLTPYNSKILVTIQTIKIEVGDREQMTFNTLVKFLLPIQMTRLTILNEAVKSTIKIERSHSSHFEISLRLLYNGEASPQGFQENRHIVQVQKAGTQALPTTYLEAFNCLQCRSCGNSVIKTFSSPKKRPTLKRVLPLPEGHWDEISDYISCFETSTIDFSGTSLRACEGCAFDDSSSILLHRKDTANVSIMAVNGYGENSPSMIDQQSILDKPHENRDLLWMTDSSDRATICCNQCCDILGHSPLSDTDAYRLLKHKVSAPLESQSGLDCFERFKCCSFIARELVRYVETYGIFSFVIKKSAQNDDELHYSCLLLNVLSVNTEMGHTQWDRLDSKLTDVELKQVVKVIFEQTTSWKENNPRQLKWGNVDFCCLPFDSLSRKENVSKGAGSYAILYLSVIEWQELHETLMEGMAYFDEIVAAATVRLRLGDDSNQKASLTVLTMA